MCGKRDKFFGLYTFAELEMSVGFLFFIALPTLYGDCGPKRSFYEISLYALEKHMYRHTHIRCKDVQNRKNN